MKKSILLRIALLLVGFSSATLYAQNRLDALRWSQSYYEGTARFSSMGGAFSALGGDFTTLSINPAGVGVYRTSEFSFTPALSFSNTSTDYLDSRGVSDSYTRFGVSSLGVVMPVLKSYSTGGITSFNLAIGYNKMNNFNVNTTAVANASSYSIRTNFVDFADAIGLSSGQWKEDDLYYWPLILAFDTWLINEKVEGGNKFEPVGGVRRNNQNHYFQTESRGSTGEYVFSMGGNVSHKLYFGATIGLQDIDHEIATVYRETIINPSPPEGDLKEFEYRRIYNTTGSGMNFKIGAIYRPISDLRLGFAVHTPTWFKLTEMHFSRMLSRFLVPRANGVISYDKKAPDTNKWVYKVNTPFKLVGGAAYTFQRYGLISIDYEYVDYSSIKMKDAPYFKFNYTNENIAIKQEFKGASNIRVGAEGNIDNFAIRAGYAFYASPYKNDSFTENGVSAYSVGLGYRFNGGFVDLGYSLTQKKSEFMIDDYSYSNPAENLTTSTKDNFSRILLTVGFKF